MRRHSASLVLLPSLVLVGGLLVASGAGAEILERVIAKVNGEIITQTEFQSRQLAAAQAARIDPDKVPQFLRENNAKILQEAVDELLLVQRADEAGLRLRPEYIKEVIDNIKKENKIANDEELQAQLAREGMTLDDLKRNIEHSIVRRQILSREVEGKVAVTDAEAKADYDARKDDFSKPATVTLQEIYVKADGGGEALAKDLVKRARAGEDFGELAKAHSAGGTRAAGGDLGKLTKGDLNPALEKVAFGLSKGAVSDPIRSGDGYRIFKAVDKAEASVVPFEEAKADIKQKLMQERWQKEYDAYMADLRKKAVINLMVREAPLQLSGAATEGAGLNLGGVGEAGAVGPAAKPPAEGAGAAESAGAKPPADPDAEISTSGSDKPEQVAPPPPTAKPSPKPSPQPPDTKNKP
jgi:parvulin-like peptidyl-prolyl isomerase